MKKIRFTLISLLLLISCQALKAQSLVGTWVCDRSENDETLVMTMTFNEDGTFVRNTEETMYNFRNQPSVVRSQEEGKWKLVAGGKKIYMRIIPSTVKSEADKESHSKIAKLNEVSEKVAAVQTIHFAKIVSLTENELVIIQQFEDEDGDDYKLKSTFIRQN